MTQFVRACSAEAEIVARRKSGPGGASPRNNREGRTHDTLHGAFGDARKVFGENAVVGKLRGVIGPNYANEPMFARLFRTGRSDLSDRNIQERLEARIEH